MNLKHLRITLGLALCLAPVALAQTPTTPTPGAPPPPACPGTVTIVRISQVKPGKLNDFMAAVAAHEAWYRAHGVTTNHIYASRILKTDPATKQSHYSDTNVMTFHVNPPHDTNLPRNDDAWKAYVKQYQDSSSIKSEYLTCSPAPIP